MAGGQESQDLDELMEIENRNGSAFEGANHTRYTRPSEDLLRNP